MHYIKSLGALLLLSIALSGHTHAIDFGGLKDKAAATTESADGSQLMTIGKTLYSAFAGNETATKYAKGMIGSLQSGKYSKVFDYYDKIKGANLSMDQLTSWNGIKNTVSAFVLKQGITSDDSTTDALIGKATDALEDNNTSEASSYLSKLKSLGTLAKSDTSLLSKIQANVLPLVMGK